VHGSLKQRPRWEKKTRGAGRRPLGFAYFYSYIDLMLLQVLGWVAEGPE
jgi:hypothetical protein